MCTLHAVIMLCFWHQHLVSRSGVQQVCTLDLLNCLLTKLWMETYDGPTWRLISTLSSLGNRSMLIQDVYVGTFPQFIRNASYARAHAHAYPHTPTRTRTHTGSSLSKGPASLRPCPAGSALWRLRCPTTRSPSRMSRPARLKWAAAEVRARDARACKADRAFCGGCPCRLCPRRCENVWGCAPFLKALGTHCISRSGPRPPTRIAYSPASPLSPWLPNPRHTHTHGPRQQGCVQCTWHGD